MAGDGTAGWIPITIDTNTAAWTDDGNGSAPPSAAFSLAVRVGCGATSGAKVLIAFDSLNCTSSGDPVDQPGTALPLGTTTPCAPEVAIVKGLTCGNSWTIEVVGEIPEDVCDQTVPIDTRPGVDNRILCSFNQSGVGSITAHMDVANQAIVFRIPGVFGDIAVKPASVSFQEFYFVRGSAIFLGVSCNFHDGAPHYTCHASVGHTPVQHSDETEGSTTISPDHIYFCSDEGTDPEPMLWWAGRVITSQRRLQVARSKALGRVCHSSNK